MASASRTNTSPESSTINGTVLIASTSPGGGERRRRSRGNGDLVRWPLHDIKYSFGCRRLVRGQPMRAQRRARGADRREETRARRSRDRKHSLCRRRCQSLSRASPHRCRSLFRASPPRCQLASLSLSPASRPAFRSRSPLASPSPECTDNTGGPLSIPAARTYVTGLCHGVPQPYTSHWTCAEARLPSRPTASYSQVRPSQARRIPHHGGAAYPAPWRHNVSHTMVGIHRDGIACSVP